MGLRDKTYCVNGHKVTEDSLYYVESDGKYRCRECRREYKRRHDRRRRGQMTVWEDILAVDLKHHYRLECSHENTFSVGLPQRGDIVYCYKCADYRRVLGAARGR